MQARPLAATTDAPLHFPEPREIDGYWAWDRIHAPRPVTPLAGDAVIMLVGEGFTIAQHEFGSPLAARFRIINNYVYGAFVADELLEPQSRDPGEYMRNLEQHAFGVGERWINEWEPALRRMLGKLRTADFASMSDCELLDALDERLRELLYEWTIHGWINLSLVPATTLTDFYNHEIGPDDPNEAWQLTQGYENKSVEATRRLWHLAQVVRTSTTLQKIVMKFESREVLDAFERSEEGRSFLAEFGLYLDEFGWRSDDIYEIASPAWREEPSILLSTIQGYLRLGEDNNPDVALERARRRREELTDKAHAGLTNDPEKLERFNVLMEAARYNLRVTEDHSYWIDQMGVAAFRRFCLAVGTRLAAKGIIDRTEDVFFLYVDELRDALREGGDRRALVARRRASYEESARIVPPRFVGEPTPPETDPFVLAIVDKMMGMLPVERSTDPDVITGVAASPGTAHGTARVVRTLAEASKLREGDIMVCELTVPPWVPLFAMVKAIVTDTGGILSHCAIVAREFRLPAVVGTHVGTTLIKDGMMVTVDGTKGIVRIDTRVD